MKRGLVCFGLLMAVAGPGFSQTTKAPRAFYIVLDTMTGNCTVVGRLPRTDTPNITIATDAIYETRAEAETAIKTLTPCKR